jgi:hypothetical protein
VNKDWLWKLQMDALESRAIGSDACRLLLLLCKRHHRNLCSHFPEPFKLSVADAAAMLGYSRESDKTGERAIGQLIQAKYLLKRSVTGSPPTTSYLISNSCQPTGIKSGQPTGIKSGQPTGIKSGQPTGNHISSSLREEIEPNGSNSSQGEFNGSLRSKETKGNKLAAPPAARLDEAARARCAHALSQLRGASASKTGTGTLLRKKHD